MKLTANRKGKDRRQVAMKLAEATTGRRRADRRQEGAAMLFVMLVLLVATATAAISVQSTNFELRASGYARRAAQTAHVAESALVTTLGVVDRAGPKSFLYAMERSESPIMQSFNEPELVTGKQAYRVFSDDFANDSVPVVRSQSEADVGSLGPKQAYQPWFAVDIYDVYTAPARTAGYHVEGQGNLVFMHATYIARGMTIERGAANPTQGAVNQSARNHCACAQSGPFVP